MTVFITTVVKSCGKSMRGLLQLKKRHEGKQWCVFLTSEEKSWRRTVSAFVTYWSTVMKENNDGVYYYCIRTSMWENGEVAF